MDRKSTWISRILALLWLLLAAILYVRTDSFLGPALISGTFIMYIGMMIFGALSGKRLVCEIEAPGRAAKGETSEVLIRIKNQSAMPVLFADTVLDVSNAVTGETKRICLPFSVIGHGKCEQKISLKERFCGKCEYVIDGAAVSDMMHFFVHKRDLQGSGQTIVMPDVGEITPDEQSREASDMESFRYSQTRKGPDVSETFAIREYQPGDSIKRIHWKLSYKTGDTMVKESSYPIFNSMLLLLETGFISPEEMKPEWMDTMTEVTMSLAAGLTAKGIGFEICTYDQKEGKLYRRRIDTEDDLWAAAGMLLSAHRAVSEENVMERFLEEFSGQPFAHMVYITAGARAIDTEFMPNESILTTLRCGSMASEEGEITEYGFTPENWHEELQYIRI